MRTRTASCRFGVYCVLKKYVKKTTISVDPMSFTTKYLNNLEDETVARQKVSYFIREI